MARTGPGQSSGLNRGRIFAAFSSRPSWLLRQHVSAIHRQQAALFQGDIDDVYAGQSVAQRVKGEMPSRERPGAPRIDRRGWMINGICAPFRMRDDAWRVVLYERHSRARGHHVERELKV